MMQSRFTHPLAIVLTTWIVSSVPAGKYEKNPPTRNVVEAIRTVSFSGDLDEIFDAAETLADQDHDTTVDKLTFDKDSTLGCSVSFDDSELVRFTYGIVTQQSQDEGPVRRNLEKQLNEAIAFYLLDCNDSRRMRNLQRKEQKLESPYKGIKDSGLIGVDYRPVDKPSSTEKCSPTLAGHLCTVVNGGTWIFLPHDSNLELAKYHTLSVIRDFLNSASNSVNGLTDAILLSPDLPNEKDFDSDRRSDGSKVSASDGLSTQSIIILSLAIVLLVGVVGIALLLRRSRPQRREKQGNSQVEHVPTMEDKGSFSDDGPLSPVSPFGIRLPTAYQLTDSMSVILEQEGEEKSMSQSDIVMVSEGWTTEDDSSVDQVSTCSRFTATPVLGARRRMDILEGDNSTNPLRLEP